MWDR